MSKPYFKISGGYVYDPLNGVDGQVQDIWVQDGRIVPAPVAGIRADRTLDAAGYVVMPGGVDMHCHIAGPKVNMGRKMRPEEKRQGEVIPRTLTTHSGTLGSVPSTFATGFKYIGLGYTSAFDAAVPPLSARHAHEEFADTPAIDKGFYVLMGNNHFMMKSISEENPKQLKAFIAWLLGATKAYAPKLVNPGGVEVWKHHPAGNVDTIDQIVDHYEVTPRQIISEVARATNELGLPHPVHIHCNNLGMPGNWSTTLNTMDALNGFKGHLTHIQFHSYGGGEGSEESFCSKTTELADYINTHDNLTVDVGQVMFGKTTSMTGDGPLGYFLHNVYGGKWLSVDTEMESGCGIAPIEYRNKSLVHALQWAIGLEWYLLVEDPWRVVMSTDHPNGGSFMAYPQIIRLLMDATYRNDVLRSVHPDVMSRCVLGDIDREYTLNEICIITRAGPAKILGLKHKGHLGVGADADITIYSPHENKEVMFEMPRYVIKSGEILIDECELKQQTFGKTFNVAPAYDVEVEADIADWFEQYYSVQFRNYPISDDYVHDSELVDCHEKES
ncbi:MAG: formylmethanofuran dehydrogenase subunit A [Planctomycetaceae bacterium]|jgi:formylmethanofuran dehydrogenase subunit A|nr:formylmethanofuran dehydrogenase subunit A [Planctomycetaceae bacterium]MBT4012964.1 formylmethanofuran dehydrogenase subunit A [Planctomycetaceae bacterium]MBT4723449.1 formylmethanofuran dehydrogenase subunit A [Planctomycetaceae bacterium]MBT4844549.1 formylmethanofuran dehydrogenase subunit A [Planctomycetaceae bacterium]MBT5125911.1 formylmethanofuran dehydrogenase subunit A [Planctomycetaceae bacterium]